MAGPEKIGNNKHLPAGEPGSDRLSVYWFKMPDDEAIWANLMSLRHSELKCYLLVARAIQRDRNSGKLSIRKIAERAKLNPKHAHAAVRALLGRGLLVCYMKPGSTGVYRLPSDWRTSVPTSEQSPEPFNRTPSGELWTSNEKARGRQACAPAGKQSCTPVGEQHLEFLERSESHQSGSVMVGAPRLIDFHEGPRTESARYGESQRNAVKRAVAACNYKPTDELLAKLVAKAKFYRVTGFVIAANIQRAWSKIERQPSNWPRSDSWFTTVVENELADAKVPREQAAASRTSTLISAIRSTSVEPRSQSQDSQQAMPTPANAWTELHTTIPLLSAPTSGIRICPTCSNSGIRDDTGDPQLWAWCECAAGAQKRKEAPGAVDEANVRVHQLKERCARPTAAPDRSEHSAPAQRKQKR